MALNLKNIQDRIKNLSKKVVRAKSSEGEEIEVEIIEDEDKTLDDIEFATAHKKPRLKAIHILIILLLVVFLFVGDDLDFTSTDSTPSIDATLTEPVKLPEPVAPPEPVESVEVAQPIEPVESIEVAEPIETIESTEVAEPIETIESTEVAEPIETIESIEVTEPSETVEFGEDNEPGESIEMGEDTTASESIESPGVTEADEVAAPLDENETTPMSTVNEASSDIDEIKMATDILEDSGSDNLLEEIQMKLKQEKLLGAELDKNSGDYSAPLYNKIGRGLVYNCLGKHFACVNANTYKQCQKNYNWVNEQGSKTQCYPYNVYASDKDCDLAQTKAMTENKMTDYCL